MKSFVPIHKEIPRNVTEVLGLSFGDEGKGKILCYLAKDADIIVKSAGGINDKHTVVYNGVKYPLQYIPTGILCGKATCIIGPGMYIDLQILWDEIELLRKNNITITPMNLKISDRAVVILPYDIIRNDWEEKCREESGLDTDTYGIGAPAVNKVMRIAVRMIDIKENTYVKRIDEIFKLCPKEILDANPHLKHKCIEYCMEYSYKLIPFIRNTQQFLNQACLEEKEILFEGSHSYYRSITNGYYPYTTVTDSDASGILSGGCVGPLHVKMVVGVFKAYTSKLGGGSFPTEVLDKKDVIIRCLGNEYQKNTKTPRRVGWLDLVQIKNAVEANGVNCLAITHLDTIGKIGLSNSFIEVCTSYCNKYTWWERYEDGVPTDYSNVDSYETKSFLGWEIPENCKRYEDLPAEAKKFLRFIEQYVGVPIAFISIGPENEDLIVCRTCQNE